MSKPLELTIYPKDPSYDHDDAFTVYLLGDGKKECAGTSCALPSKKRLAEAELAAEAYKAEAEFRAAAGYGYSVDIIKECDRKRSVLQRFATLPHYDEVQS